MTIKTLSKITACSVLVAVIASSGALAQGDEAAYRNNCLVCHQADGRGVPGTFPDLTESDVVKNDAKAMIRWVLLSEKPEGFESLGGYAVMPAFTYLTDDELAAALSFVRSEFGGAGPVTPEQVAAERN